MESDDDYDYTREVPMPSDDEDEDLLQDVLAKLLEYMSENRLSIDALFQRYNRDRAGWSQTNFMDALRDADMHLPEDDALAAFGILAARNDAEALRPDDVIVGMEVARIGDAGLIGTVRERDGARVRVNFSSSGGAASEWLQCYDLAVPGRRDGDSSRITARTFNEEMHAAKRVHLGEHVRRKETRSLPPVDRGRRKRVFDRADVDAMGWLHEDQVTQALAELYPSFRHAESELLAFEAAAVVIDGTRCIRLREFGLLIEYLRYLNSKWSTFEDIGRRRSSLNLAQFTAACRDVLPHEVSARDAEHEFHEVLGADDDGTVEFQEFAKWAAMRAVPGNDYRSPEPRRGTLALETRPRGPVLRENLKMQTSLGMRWEKLHVVIDSRPEEVGKEVFTFAVYSSEQAYDADEKARAGPFAVSDCVCIIPDDDSDQFSLSLLDTEYRFKATDAATSALEVADAVRGCQYCELINWTSRELCDWLALSKVPDPTLERLAHYDLPGMQFAKLCARDDMVARLQEELEEMTGLPDNAILDVLRPVRYLQTEPVRVWLEQTNKREKGRRAEIVRAVKTWRQHVAIENAKMRHGGAHVPKHAIQLDDGSPRFSSEDELEDDEDGVLYVTVVKADKLPRLDLFGYDRVRSPSLYVHRNMEDQQRNTATADDTYEPKWNTRFKLNVTSPESILLLDVYNSNMMTDHLHWATLKVPLLELAEGTTWNWYRLADFEDESRSEARHNVLTEEQRQDQKECPKGCIQLKFQYAPPKVALDRHQKRGIRVSERRGAVIDIDRFVGAYAADELDVEARITQGLLWSTRYVVISSIYKGSPPAEKFVLMTYKDKHAWDNGSDPLYTWRLGESEIVRDERPESRGAGFAVTSRKGSAHFRAKSERDADDWLTALRALQYAEMTQWNSAHVCRWLEAQKVPDEILHCVHKSGVSGDFFARTVAANTYDMSTTQLQEKAGLKVSAATTVIGKLRAAELGSTEVAAWLEEANRDIRGKSMAVKQSTVLLRSHGVGHEVPLAGAPPPAASRPTPRARLGEAEHDARDAAIEQRLEVVRGVAGGGGGGGGRSTQPKRFDPMEWQAKQSQKKLELEQKKLRKAEEELQQHQAQTRGANPRPVVYSGGPNNPDLSNTKSKFREAAAQHRERVVERAANESAAASQLGRTPVQAPAPGKTPRLERVPAAMRDPKRLEPKEKRTGNELATKLESLVAVHRNLQEHQPLIEAITECLREKDRDRMSNTEVLRREGRARDKHNALKQRYKEMAQQCAKQKKKNAELWAANEGLMKRGPKDREGWKKATEQRDQAIKEKDEAENKLKLKEAKLKELAKKYDISQELLEDRRREYLQLRDQQERDTGRSAGPDQESLQKKVKELEQTVQRVRRAEEVARHEATERGKVLVGAAEKLEAEQKKIRDMKAQHAKAIMDERMKGKAEAKQEADHDTSELKTQIHNATELVFEISQVLGLRGTRFQDADEMSRHNLIKAVKESIAKSGKHTAEKKAAQKEVRQLKAEVKELQSLLRQEQDASYKMLDHVGAGKSKSSPKAKGGGSCDCDALKKEIEKLKSLIAVHETQMEGERRNTAREKDRAMKLEQELRLQRKELRAEKEHTETLSRHRVHLERTTEMEDRHSKARLREHKQEQRISKMHAGQWVHKYHEGGSSDKRWLSLSADNKMLLYGKSKAKSTKEIPIDDIRYIHFGYVSENITTRHAEIMNTPEWMCFGIVLRTRTIDFSAESEEDAALWVVGLRTLLEQKRGDARGRAVGHFFWSRASMKTKALYEASELEYPGRYNSHMSFISQKVREAADTYDGGPGATSIMSPGTRLPQPTYSGGGSVYGASGYGGGNTTLAASPGVARRLSPGVTRRMSPQRMSFESPAGGGRYLTASPRDYSASPRGRYSTSPRGGNPRSPGSFGASQSRISPRRPGGVPTTRASPSSGRSLSPAGRRRD